MRVPVPEDAVDSVSGAARARLHADDFVAQQSSSQSLSDDAAKAQLIRRLPLCKARCRSQITTN